MILSNYVFSTESMNKKYGLLYNSKTDFFLRYNLNDFQDLKELEKYDEIVRFLEEHDFIKKENEKKEVAEIINQSIKSEDTLMLILKVTRKCNFRCVYCYEDYSKPLMEDEVQNGIINFVEKELKKGKIKNLVISWFGGEPMLNIDGIKKMASVFIRICNEYEVIYTSNIVTNGYLLDKKNVDILLNCGIDTFQITVDGPEHIHNKQRRSLDGKKTYGTILKNLFDLKDRKEKFSVILRTNISKQMLGRMDEYIEDIKPLFQDERFYALYHPVVDFDTMVHEVSDRQILDEMLYGIKKGMRFTPLTEFLSIKNSLCYAMQENRYVVDVDGTISKCTVVNEPYSIVGFISKDGTIVFNKNENVWKGARISDKCTECNYFAACGGGACPLYYLKRGHARCMKYKDEEMYVLKIADLQEVYDLTLHL